MLRSQRKRFHRIETRCEPPPKAEALRILQALNQLRDMPTKLRRQVTRAVLFDRIGQLRGPAAKVDRLALVDEPPGRFSFKWITIPKMPIGLGTRKSERPS